MQPPARSPYVWKACLGRGSTGEVWAAERDGKELAVKLLLDTRPGSPHAEAIRREMRLGPLLEGHPGIASVRAVEIFEGTLHLEMEWVKGPSLEQVLEGRVAAGRGGIPARVAVDWARQILTTLHWAGEKVDPDTPGSFLHRDIKPANLLLEGRTGAIRITDFGMARASTELGFQTTQTGIVKGTPRFMAPELLLEKPVDARADQFSVGVMLYELLSGDPLYKGRNLADVLIMAVNCDFGTKLDTLAAPDPLVRVIRTMLSRDANDRFESHQAAVHALSALDVPGPEPEAILRELLEDALDFELEETTDGPVLRTKTRHAPQALAVLETSNSDPLFPDEEVTMIVKALPTMGEHVAFPETRTVKGNTEITFSARDSFEEDMETYVLDATTPPPPPRQPTPSARDLPYPVSHLGAFVAGGLVVALCGMVLLGLAAMAAAGAILLLGL